MAEFAVVNEFNIVTNVIIANSFEEADALTEDTYYEVSGVGIGFIYYPEEEKFLSPEEYQELVVGEIEVIDAAAEAEAAAEADNPSEPTPSE